MFADNDCGTSVGDKKILQRLLFPSSPSLAADLFCRRRQKDKVEPPGTNWMVKETAQVGGWQTITRPLSAWRLSAAIRTITQWHMHVHTLDPAQILVPPESYKDDHSDHSATVGVHGHGRAVFQVESKTKTHKNIMSVHLLDFFSLLMLFINSLFRIESSLFILGARDLFELKTYIMKTVCCTLLYSSLALIDILSGRIDVRTLITLITFQQRPTMT